MPRQRAVAVSTSACGSASATQGSGVIVAEGLVVTAAHVVIGSTAVAVGDEAFDATVVGLDTVNDLALLWSAELGGTSVEFGAAETGDVVVIEASADSIEARVERRLSMSVDEVRSTLRVRREGFELVGPIVDGHSGAGVFDAAGRLTGTVFATSTERDSIGFAVDASEVAALVAATRVDYVCDPAQSRLRQQHDSGART